MSTIENIGSIPGTGSGIGEAVAHAASQPEDASVKEITVRAPAR